MNIAFVGCGYVADLYIQTLKYHPNLKVVGVYDRDAERTRHFADHHGLRAYEDYDQMLHDPSVSIVLNLTNPSSHYEVSREALEAGKHVYSEKPLAMTVDGAQKLVDLAEQRGLHLSGAPCSVLSETAQTMWKAVRSNSVGPIRLVYAEMDDGMLHKMAYDKWVSESGIAWPYKDEFEVGCTLEHAGYCVTWLAAMFGPAETVTAFSSVQIPRKCSDEPLDSAPDFSVAAIRFANGTVARLTCSVVAPHDHEMRLIGDDGILSVKDCWFYQAPVYERKWLTIRRRTMLSPIPKKIKPLGMDVMPQLDRRGSAQMDFLRGVSELAEAIEQKRLSRLAPDFSLHICELVLAISDALDGAPPHQMTTTFEPMQPMPWAADDPPRVTYPKLTPRVVSAGRIDKTVLVTGAGGFIGRHVVDALAARGATVKALVRSAESTKFGPGVQIHQGDLLQPETLEGMLDGVDSVIHLAMRMRGSVEAQIRCALQGTTNLLTAMEQTDVHRIVLASSLAVYDWDQVRGSLSEDSPVLHDDENLTRYDGYTIAKVRQEALVRSWCQQHDGELTVMRPGMVWGRGNDYPATLGQRIGPMHLVINPDIDPRMTHVANTADAFAASVTSDASIGQTYNIVDGHDISAWQYVEKYLRRGQHRGFRISVPYEFGLLGAKVIHKLASLFGQQHRLPGLAMPWRFRSRFATPKCSATRLANDLDWTPPFDVRSCEAATFGVPTAGEHGS
ncbi:Gfo/Idh/MocA family oxidoreductase [Planctomycetales bacterium ZRK34]|nr:Gfo/Idh/MocA family oxidoreductase [Planctomycetales bacterium ZRK34]